MQLKQIKSEKLKRIYDVTVPANAIESKMNQKLQQLSQQIKMPGFRPGKVPLDIIRKKHGQRVMGEVLETVVSETMQKAISQEKLKPALQPKVEIKTFEEGKDLTYSMELEVLPEVPAIDLSAIEITKTVVDLAESDIQNAIERIAEGVKDYQPADSARAAKQGDAVKIDFKGYIGDEPFEGGEAKDYQLALGSGSFIPGFEDQLVGAKSGEQKKITVTFPENYPSRQLAGKDAVFEVKVNSVLEAKSQAVDETLAKKLGFESLEKLKQATRDQLAKEIERVVRMRSKKELFDTLDTLCDFLIPEQMEKAEFDSIWQQLQHAKEHNPEAEEFKTPEAELRKEYEAMSRRRVRLGILLAELGKEWNVRVSPQELQQAMIDEARRFPGQETQVIEYFRQHPGQLETLRGPILEEKVVEQMFGKIKFKETRITLEQLRSEEEDEGDAPKKPEKKKASGDKAPETKKKPASGKKK